MKIASKPRDMRLDALRGVFLVIMAAVHVPTPVSHWLQEPFGYTSSAEGFIFLGACLSGIVYGRTYWRSDWKTMSRRAWARSRLIYFVHLGVLLPVALIAWMCAGHLAPLANHFHDFLEYPAESLALFPLLLHQPPLFDILPLYVIFLGITPVLLAIARRKSWTPVVIGSGLVWLIAQCHLDAWLLGDPAKWLPLRWGSFDILGWQLVWVAGLALGETSGRRAIIAPEYRVGFAGVAVGVLIAGFLTRHGLLPHAWIPDQINAWVDKWTLGPLRVLNFGAWVVFMLSWNPRPPSWLMAPTAMLGRNSLAVFAFHLPLVIAATTVIEIYSPSDAVNTGIGLLVIGLLFPWAAWRDYRKSRPALPAPAPHSPPPPPAPARTGDPVAKLHKGVAVRPLFPPAQASD